jgi:hypothetical protein
MENDFAFSLVVACSLPLKYHLAGIETGLSKSTREGKKL